jgi:hypothetical protein
LNESSAVSTAVSAPITSDFGSQPPRDEEECARLVVRSLLDQTKLTQFVNESSLEVSVGGGNWISYSFHLIPRATMPMEGILRFWKASGVRLLRRRWKPAGNSPWFRSSGVPSLHFQLLLDDPQRGRGGAVHGHVDAADPWGHPVRHLLRDYLPTHGIGAHSTPREIWSVMRRTSHRGIF